VKWTLPLSRLNDAARQRLESFSDASTIVTDSSHFSHPDEPVPYTPGAKGLHWLLAALLLGQIAFGWFLTTIPRGSPVRGYYVNLHKSTGLTLAALILIRILWRATHAAPPLPSFMPTWERSVARSSHRLLYLAMIVLPLSGYLASNFSKYGIKLFNAVSLPPWGSNDPQLYALLNGTHVATAYIFAGLIVIHVLAALRHAMRRDGVFARMWS
jgi:cytochrome b561